MAGRPAAAGYGYALGDPQADAELYAEIQRFYAGQVQLLGAGDIDRWALTFTEDALFEQEANAGRVFAGNAPPVRTGRAAIAAAARGAVAARRNDSQVRRYHIGMLTVRPERTGGADGEQPVTEVRTHYCALLLQTPEGGRCAPYLSTTGRDRLVRHDGRWQVAHRVNSHDSAAGSDTGREERDNHV